MTLPAGIADSQELESEGSNTHQQCFPDVVQVEQQEAADLNGLLRRHSMHQTLPLYLHGITVLPVIVERIQCRTHAYQGS